MWLARVVWILLAFAAFGAGSARAQDDPPGRVGRLAEVQGEVSWFDHEEGQWRAAERNRPLTSGDRVSTAPQARAELRVGSTVLHLGDASELEVLAIDDERMSFQLHSGSLALRVRSREVAEEIELVTDEARLRPLRSGVYRLDRVDDTSHAGSWRGSLRIVDPDGFVIDTGQRVELWREGRSRELRHAWGSLPDDAFAEWVIRDDRRDERSAATRHVSPEMTGAEDLDRYGRWDRHPEYGALWFPLEVRPGWAPYRYGSWAWVRPWGWTWVDEAPWGFAPFHYGRWVNWRGRWGWWPGEYVVRPVYAPALVAWVGGAHWGVSVNIGGPAIGWVPLAPREVFVPWYRVTPIYVDRINRRPHQPGRKPVPQVPTGPVMYGNQGVPGAVTVVPRDVLVQRQPVSRAVVDPRGTGAPGPPWVGVAPPPAPAAGSVEPRQGDRRNQGPVTEGRRGRPAPADTPTRRENTGPQRPPPLVVPTPRLAPPVVAPAPAVGSVMPRPAERPERRDPGTVTDRRRGQPLPADLAAQRENTGRERRPQPAAPTAVAPVAPVAPAAPVAPVAPVAPPAGVVPTVPAAAAPVAPVRPGLPQLRPGPQANPGDVDRRRERDDDRKRTPDARYNPRENLR